VVAPAASSRLKQQLILLSSWQHWLVALAMVLLGMLLMATVLAGLLRVPLILAAIEKPIYNSKKNKNTRTD